MPEDMDYEEPEAEEDEEANMEYEEEEEEAAEAEMDMKSTMKDVVSVLKNVNERLERLEKEAPPEDDVEGSDDDPTDEEPEGEIVEPDEDAATQEDSAEETEDAGDAMTMNKGIGFSKASTPKPRRRSGGDSSRIQKAVQDKDFFRKAAREGDFATITNAAARASRQACGRGNNGGIRKMQGNDEAKQQLLKWIDNNLDMGVL